MYVSREHKTAFILMPTNAVKHVTTLMDKSGGGDEGSGLFSLQPPTENMRHYTAFAVVRNPFARVVCKWLSSFREFDVKNSQVRQEAFQAYVADLRVGKHGLNGLYPSTQASVIDAAQKHFDAPIHVLKYENLREEWEGLSLLGSFGKVRQPDSEVRWKRFYSHPALVQSVASFYYADLDRFGYPDTV